MNKSQTNQITGPVAKLLLDKNFAFISTLMSDGSPQVTPTWIDVEDNIILINTAKGRIKHKNISRDPRVAVSVIDHNNPYNMVSIRGIAIEQSNEGADEHIDKLAKKYLGVDKYPMRSPNEKRIIVKIKPEKIFYIPPS
ncbi:MAG TPA: PPOX class F420-dependent oxidoreductase [Nitrososphaeraceae archaeon]|jgi:PPOX class probable F420-dependent enzyme